MNILLYLLSKPISYHIFYFILEKSTIDFENVNRLEVIKSANGL